MKKIKYISLTCALILGFSACEQDVIELKAPETPAPTEDCPAGASAGSANFTKYIALGNSLTAGMQAGALFTEGQNTSLGKILSTQFACVGGGAFNQPDINSQYGFYFGGGNPLPNGTVLGRLLLQGTPPSPRPTISDQAALPSPLNPGFMYSGDKTALNNFAVPLIQIGQILIPETGDWTKADIDPNTPGNQPDPRFNPLYARFASNPGTSTILGDAMGALANGGTFFSFWLGNNDILGYALSGGANPAIYTSTTDFGMRFNFAINTLLSVPDVKGVVGNIPDITSIPYFRLVPHNPVPMTNQDLVNQINGGYGAYNGALDNATLLGAISAEERDRRKIQFDLGQNPVVIEDESLTDLSGFGIPSYREATPNDRLVLTASTFIGTPVNNDPTKVNGVTVPLADQWVLVPAEQDEIKQRTAAFNAIIATAVENSGDRLALADVNAKLNALTAAGYEVVDGVTIVPSLAPPTGGFSEDGIHPNSRGVAYIANAFIDAINQKFGASIPSVRISKYSSTGLPVNP